MVYGAAIGAAVLLVGVAVFQVVLALGVPWGAISYGGRVATEGGVLPLRYRIMSAVAALILVLAAWVVLARADVSPAGPLGEGMLKWATWVICGYLVLNTVMNIASRSAAERWVMGSVTAVAAVLCLIVVL